VGDDVCVAYQARFRDDLSVSDALNCADGSATVLRSDDRGASVLIGDDCGRSTAIGWEYAEGILESERVHQLDLGLVRPTAMPC
jgi:hypothetical protein